MVNRVIEYSLEDSYVHNWLVAGPLSRPIEQGSNDHWKADAARQWFEPELNYSLPPVERGDFRDGLSWHYAGCQLDHLVDVSAFALRREYFKAWAYTRLKLHGPETVTGVLSTLGPADVWVNGKQVYRTDEYASSGVPQTGRFAVQLAVENEISVRFDQAGIRAVPHAFSLRLEGVSPTAKVQVPVQAKFPHRIIKFEKLFDKAYLEEAASYRGRVINLRFSEGADTELRYNYSIQDSDGMIYVEGTWDVNLTEPVDIGHPQRIFERPAFVVLRAPGKEYYDQELRYQRAIPVYLVDNSYSPEPYADYPTRRKEGLEDAARRDGSLFDEIAKMALDRWDKIDSGTVLKAVDQVNRREAGSEVQLVGLLGMVDRFGANSSFPKNISEAVAHCALNYAYSPDENLSGVDFSSESSQILLLTAELLAGQRYPQQEFSISCQKGSEHQAAAESRAKEWMSQRGKNGFMEWDSPVSVENNLVALSHLVSLSKNNDLTDLAAVVMDKILFLLTVNSFHGMLGGSQGKASSKYHSAAVKTGRVQASAGLSRLLLGMGIYHAENAGVVSLSLSTYEFPSFFTDMAFATPESFLSREHHRGETDEVNKVLYKTPDYLLGSAQDYHPGKFSRNELIWQAVLGEDALIFANHPLAFNQDEGRQPGFWVGNASLPRTAQWKDLVISVFNGPEDTGLDFTHAYFPIYAFDEYTIEKGWVFGRKGMGYVALCAMNGVELVKQAPDGYREIRSPGRKNIWICQMGRVAEDGNFPQFRQKVLGSTLQWKDLGVEMNALRGDGISFGWEGDLKINGQATAITGFNHIDNPYCKASLPANFMDVEYQEYVMRMNFE